LKKEGHRSPHNAGVLEAPAQEGENPKEGIKEGHHFDQPFRKGFPRKGKNVPLREEIAAVK